MCAYEVIMLYTFFMCVRVCVCVSVRLLLRTCVPISNFWSSRLTFMDLYKIRLSIRHCCTSDVFLHFLKPLKLWRRAKLLSRRDTYFHLWDNWWKYAGRGCDSYWTYHLCRMQGKNVAAIRQVLLPFGMMAVHVGSTDVKSGAETDYFVNQQLQTWQRLGTLDYTRKVHYISDVTTKRKNE